jgi:hypothetical protein
MRGRDRIQNPESRIQEPGVKENFIILTAK